MEIVTREQELTVWADASVLAEAKHLFSHFEAAIRPIPKTCHSKDLQKSKVSVVYLKHSEPRKDHLSLLECFKSTKVEFLLFYMPHDSSSLAFRWGKMVGKECVDKTDWAFNFQHLKQILRLRNVIAHSGPEPHDQVDLPLARKRLGLTQEQMAKALNVAPRTIQNWESGVGRSQMAKKTQDLKELLQLMDEFVVAPKEQEWLQTPLPAIRNQTPVQAIIEGKMRDIIVEFLRLGEGQPV
jgi:transcriptional regulator with XRE-family HTH domain